MLLNISQYYINYIPAEIADRKYQMTFAISCLDWRMSVWVCDRRKKDRIPHDMFRFW